MVPDFMIEAMRLLTNDAVPIVVFGLANLFVMGLILLMPYRRKARRVPLILATISFGGWAIFSIAPIKITDSELTNLYLLFDIAFLVLVMLTCFRVRGTWRHGLVFCTVISFANMMGVKFLGPMDPLTEYGAALLNNLSYAGQLFFLGLSAFSESIRRKLNRSRNQTNYFRMARERGLSCVSRRRSQP